MGVVDTAFSFHQNGRLIAISSNGNEGGGWLVSRHAKCGCLCYSSHKTHQPFTTPIIQDANRLVGVQFNALLHSLPKPYSFFRLETVQQYKSCKRMIGHWRMHATITPRMTQQLKLDGVNVLCEFRDHWWARNDGLAFDFWFSFRCWFGSAEVTKPRGEVVVDLRPPKHSNPFSDTYRRIGTLVVPLLSTKMSLEQAMLQHWRVISIKLIKIKFQAHKNSNSSISIYTTLFRITALQSLLSSNED